MVTARIEFKAEHAEYWCAGPGQRIAEVSFESPEALVDMLRECEADIHNCLAYVNGKVIDLRKVSGLNGTSA